MGIANWKGLCTPVAGASRNLDEGPEICRRLTQIVVTSRKMGRYIGGDRTGRGDQYGYEAY